MDFAIVQLCGDTVMKDECENAGLEGLRLKLCRENDVVRKFLVHRQLTRTANNSTSSSFRVPLPVAEARLAACMTCEHWKPCHVCGAGKVNACKHPQQATRIHEKLIDLAAMRCPAGKWGPSFPLRFDQNNLAPGQRGFRFNSSLIEWQGGYALAYRDGWSGSNVHVARLDSDLKPLSTYKLSLPHKDANYGREDPRLFVYNGKLHCMFIGVVGGRTIRHTNVLYARLSDAFKVEQVFSPAIPNRNLWEKNHAYFQHGADLYAVYSIAPHRILKVNGNAAEWAYETPTPAKWTGGELRGGASPVKVGKEWWCFFHGKARHQGKTAYNVGVYVFADEPPFPILRMTPEPTLWADHSTKPADQYVSCVFPCGAVYRQDKGDWLVSMGVHDRYTEIHSWKHQDLEAALVPIKRDDASFS